MSEDTPGFAEPTEARSDRLLFYRDAGKDWRWRRIAPNGEIVGAATEGYKAFRDALINFNRVAMPKVDLDVEVQD